MKDAAWWREYRRRKKYGHFKEEGLFETGAAPSKVERQPTAMSCNESISPKTIGFQVAQPSATTATWELHNQVQPLQGAQPELHNNMQESEINAKKVVQPLATDATDATATMKLCNHLEEKVVHTLNFLADNFRKIIAVMGIMAFVLCNTAFLAYEQHTGFVALGYSLSIAWAVAVLFEVAVEILSFSVGIAQEWRWKIILSSVLVATLFVISGMISDSAKHNYIEQYKPVTLKVAEKNALILSSQQEIATKALSNYDPVNQRTKLIYATAELNKKGGLIDKLNKATSKLKAEKEAYRSSHDYADAVKKAENHGNARKIALVWNIVLIQFLGSFFRKRVLEY